MTPEVLERQNRKDEKGPALALHSIQSEMESLAEMQEEMQKKLDEMANSMEEDKEEEEREEEAKKKKDWKETEEGIKKVVLQRNTFERRPDGRALPKTVAEAKTEAKVMNLRENDQKYKNKIISRDSEKRRDWRADREQKRSEVTKILKERREKMKRKSIPFFLVPEDDTKEKDTKASDLREKSQKLTDMSRDFSKGNTRPSLNGNQQKPEEKTEIKTNPLQDSLLTEPMDIPILRNLGGLSIEKVKVIPDDKEKEKNTEQVKIENLGRKQQASGPLMSICGQKFKKKKYLEAHKRKGCKKCSIRNKSSESEFKVPTASEKEFCIDSALLEPKIEIKEEDVEINLEEATSDEISNPNVAANIKNPQNPIQSNLFSHKHSSVPPKGKLILPFRQRPIASFKQNSNAPKVQQKPITSFDQRSTNASIQKPNIRPQSNQYPSLSHQKSNVPSLEKNDPPSSHQKYLAPSLPKGWSWSRKGGPNVCYTSPQVANVFLTKEKFDFAINLLKNLSV